MVWYAAPMMGKTPSSTLSWMFVVHNASKNIRASWVKKCIGKRQSAATWGDAWRIPSTGWNASPAFIVWKRDEKWVGNALKTETYSRKMKVCSGHHVMNSFRKKIRQENMKALYPMQLCSWGLHKLEELMESWLHNEACRRNFAPCIAISSIPIK